MRDELIIKVCGMTQEANVSELATLDVDLCGFIQYPKSKRFSLNIPDSEFSKGLKRTGVFVDATKEHVLKIASEQQLDYVQLHGDESLADCIWLRSKGLKIIKVFRVGEQFDFQVTSDFEEVAEYFLFDTMTPAYGGSGKVFDWSTMHHYKGQVPFILSGGIGIENLDELKQFNHPLWIGIDLNSKFETEPGVKSIQLLKTFIDELRS